MNIVINGGTRGIGKEIVLYLSQDKNNKILVIGRTDYELKSLSEKHINVGTLVMDLTLFDEQKDKFIKALLEYFDKVDVLINVAGLLVARDFMEIQGPDARMMMETNFFGPASVIRELKPYMPSGSHIVNISSMGGFQGSSKYPGLAYYSASKAALACLTECLATEFYDSGIKINCLALGSVQTEMLEAAFPGYKAPVNAKEMAEFISNFALTGNKFFNGKILPVAVSNP